MDALLEAVGGTPWANHSIEGTLRTQAETAAAAPRPTSPAEKATARRREVARKSPTPKLAPRPVPAKTSLSREGLERLTAELAELRDTARPQIIARVKAARELGDLKENGDYEYARKEQSFIEGRIQTLEQLIRTGVVIDGPVSHDVEHEGERITYKIVGTAEANPSAGRLSDASPVGRALLGARVGDEVVIPLPGGAVTYRVKSVG